METKLHGWAIQFKIGCITRSRSGRYVNNRLIVYLYQQFIIFHITI